MVIFFTENLLALEGRKMNKPVYLGLSIIDLSKTVMYEFWYDYCCRMAHWLCMVKNTILPHKFT